MVVTSGHGAEERVLKALRAANAGQAAALPVLTTTLGWMQSDPDGVFGRIWRDAASPLRRAW
jgi:hypothetical protein